MKLARTIMTAGLFLLVISVPARAQVFGVNVGAAVPTSDLADIAGTGFGLNVYYAQLFSRSWAVSGSIGYHQFGSEDITIQDTDLSIEASVTAVRVGLIKFWGEKRRFSTGPQLGAFIPSNDIEDLDTKFGIGTRIAYAAPISDGRAIEFVFEYNNVFVGDENPLTGEDRVFFDNDKFNYLVVSAGIRMGPGGSR